MSNLRYAAIKHSFAIFGLSLVRTSTLKNSAPPDPFVEQKRLVKRDRVTILDVGAYVGWVTQKYLELFPQASIYAFEPFPPSFQMLRENLMSKSNVHLFDFGLSDRPGSLDFHSNLSAATNSLLESDSAGEATWGNTVKAKEMVRCEFTTLDEFAADNKISYIDILKMDTQGTETQILDGAKELIRNNKIGLVYSEIITMPTYKRQPRLWEALKKFDACGFDLHNFYEPSLINGRLRQLDAIFVARPRW